MVLNVHVNTAHIRYIDIIQLPFSGVNRNFKKKKKRLPKISRIGGLFEPQRALRRQDAHWPPIAFAAERALRRLQCF